MRIEVLENPDALERLDADLDWWQRAGPQMRLLAVESANRDLELLGRTFTMERKNPGTNADFEDFLRCLNEEGAEYLIVGGYAVAFHSSPRFTKDIDILIRAAPQNAPRVIRAITRFIGPPDLGEDRLVRPGVIVMMGIPPHRIDILTSIEGCVFESAWERRAEGHYGGQKVSFLSLDDLIAAKKAAGRPQDLADVERLERIKQRGS